MSRWHLKCTANTVQNASMTFDPRAALADPTRRALLAALREADGPLDVRSLAGLVGIRPNSAREQLSRLATAGLVQVTTAAPTGRGRPGLRYRATSAAVADPYRMLAGVLADHVVEGRDVSAFTTAAGERWGRDAVAAMPAAAPGDRPADPVGAVVGLMAEAGFAPDAPSPGDREVRLRACPFAPIEPRHQPVVCGIHLGFIRGALRELGSTWDAVAIEPFVQPALCVARLGRMTGA